MSSASSNPGSESSALKFCEICLETKKDKMYRIKACSHSYCCDCIVKHVSAKVADGYSSVSCPSLNCPTDLQFHTFCKMVPKAVANKWDKALCEALFSKTKKVYCPFKDCSALMILEKDQHITDCECPVCHRLFCATCGVPWHSEATCEEYKNMIKPKRDVNDLLMDLLARRMKWRRCPGCKLMVEKIEGCLHITCRCGFQFCYACGSTWSSNHGPCQPNN